MVSLGTISSAEGLKRHLHHSEYVRAVGKALTSGEVSEERIRQFVSELMRSFKPGDQFFYDPVLAALVVVMQSRYTPFGTSISSTWRRLVASWSSPSAPKVAQIYRIEWGRRRPRHQAEDEDVR